MFYHNEYVRDTNFKGMLRNYVSFRKFGVFKVVIVIYIKLGFND